MNNVTHKTFISVCMLCVIFTMSIFTNVGAYVKPVVYSEIICSEEGTVYVNGNISFGANEHISLLVVRKNADPLTTESIAMMQTVSNDDGNFVFNFAIPEDLNGGLYEGTYIAYIGTEYTDMATSVEFSYYSAETVADFIADVKDCTSADELSEFFQNSDNLEMLSAGFVGLLWDEYTNLTADNKDFASQIIFSGIDTITDKTTFINSFNSAVAFETIKSNKNDVQMFKNILADYGIYIGADISDASDQMILSLISSDCYNSVADFKNKAVELRVINEINNADYAGLTDILSNSANAEILNIKDNDEYKKYLSFDYKYDVNKQIVQRAASSYFSDADDFKKYFIGVMGNYNTDKNYSNVGIPVGSSGGGGGGGSSSSTKLNAFVSAETLNNKVTEDETAKLIFTDISDSHWAYKEISYLESKNIINGFEDNTFKPDGYVTREQLVKIIVNSFDLKYEDFNLPFTDVDKNEWYSQYISTAYNLGVVKGIDEIHFGIGENILRQDVAVILKRCIDLKGYEFEQKKNEMNFSDESSIADYAYDSIKLLHSIGVINGTDDGKFEPTSFVTRAQVAKMVFYLINN